MQFFLITGADEQVASTVEIAHWLYFVRAKSGFSTVSLGTKYHGARENIFKLS